MKTPAQILLKLVVTVADIERVDDSLLQIWKLKFWSHSRGI